MGKRRARGTLLAGAAAALLMVGYALAPERSLQSRGSEGRTAQAASNRAKARIDAAAVDSMSTSAPTARRIASRDATDARVEAECGGEFNQAILHRQARLPPSSTPEGAITRALMRSVADASATNRQVFDELLRQWPRDTGVAWVAWAYCMEHQGCDREARARHLVQLDSRNGAAWLALMDSVDPVRDNGSLEYALARAAQAPTFELRYGTIYVSLYPALAEIPIADRCWRYMEPKLQELTGSDATPPDLADVLAHLWELANMGPGFALHHACRDHDDHRIAPSRRRDCIAVMSRLVEQPSMRVQMTTLPLLIRLLGGGSASQPMREQYRQMRWLHRYSTQLRFPPGSGARIWSKGEIPYFKAQLREQGLWPPPPDWLPPDERSRLLVVEGR